MATTSAPAITADGDLLNRLHAAGDRPTNSLEVNRATVRVESNRLTKFDATLNVMYFEALGADVAKTAEDVVRGATGFKALETGLDAEAIALEAAHANEIARIAREGIDVTPRTERARDAVVPKAAAIWKAALQASRELDAALAPRLDLEGSDAAQALVFMEGMAHWTPKTTVAHAAAIAGTGSDALWAVVRGCMVRLASSPPRHWTGLQGYVEGVLSLRPDPAQLKYDAWALGREFSERSRRQIRTRLLKIVQA